MGEQHTARPAVLGLFDARIPPGSSTLLRSPDLPLPYRADLLTSVGGFDLRLVRPASSRGHRKLRDVLEHRSGVSLDLHVRGARQALRSQAVLAFLEHQLTALSWWRRRGLAPYAGLPALGIACWWAEELVAGTRDPAEVRRVLDGVDRLLVLSSNQLEIFAGAGVPADKVRAVRFGADHRYFTPVEAEPRFDAVAIGVDRGRDWGTLVAAARRLPRRRFDVFTAPGRIPDAGLPANVTVHEPVDFAVYREVLRTARLVVVPSHDLAYPTGQSVLLEAMASGRCAVVTGTSAMADYLEDGRTAVAVPPGNPSALAAAVEDVLGDERDRQRIGAAARTAVEQRFTFDQLWAEVGEHLRELMGPVHSR